MADDIPELELILFGEISAAVAKAKAAGLNCQVRASIYDARYNLTNLAMFGGSTLEEMAARIIKAVGAKIDA